MWIFYNKDFLNINIIFIREYKKIKFYYKILLDFLKIKTKII